MKRVFSKKCKRLINRWQKPDPRRLKLNVDVLLRHGLGTTVVGLLQDEHIRVMWWFAERCSSPEMTVAEIISFRRGLQIVQSCSVRELMVESDAHFIIHALLNPTHDLSYVGSIVQNTIQESKGFDANNDLHTVNSSIRLGLTS